MLYGEWESAFSPRERELPGAMQLHGALLTAWLHSLLIVAHLEERALHQTNTVSHPERAKGGNTMDFLCMEKREGRLLLFITRRLNGGMAGLASKSFCRLLTVSMNFGVAPPAFDEFACTRCRYFTVVFVKLLFARSPFQNSVYLVIPLLSSIVLRIRWSESGWLILFLFFSFSI